MRYEQLEDITFIFNDKKLVDIKVGGIHLTTKIKKIKPSTSLTCAYFGVHLNILQYDFIVLTKEAIEWDKDRFINKLNAKTNTKSLIAGAFPWSKSENEKKWNTIYFKLLENKNGYTL